jgi:hypothetical protein
LTGTLNTLGEWVRQLESLATDTVAKIAPWAAPIPTAYLVGRATIIHLQWPWWVGIVTAVTIESLGLTTTATALELREYNRSKRKSDPPAPFALAVGLVAVYLMVAIGLTVALDIVPALVDYTPALFPALSLTGVTILALRSDHRRRIEAVEADKRKRSERRSSRRSGQRSETMNNNGQGDQSEMVNLDILNRANAVRKASKQEAMNRLLEHFMHSPNASYSEAGRSVGRSKSWVAGAVSELKMAGRLCKNSNGWEVL